MKTVGICITMSGATLVVVEPSRPGWRVVAVAEIDWPTADPGTSFAAANSVVIGVRPTGIDVGGSPAAAQLLRRARRKLKLPSQQAVAVTTAPSDWCDPDSPFTAILVAKADLVRCWAVGPDRARNVANGSLAALDTVREPGLARASATESARLAAGAAIAALEPAAAPTSASAPTQEFFPVSASAPGFAAASRPDPGFAAASRPDPGFAAPSSPDPASAPGFPAGSDPAPELAPPAPRAADLPAPFDPATGFDAALIRPRIGWAVQRVADRDRTENGNPTRG